MVSLEGQILVCNAGSSSLKLGLFDGAGEKQLEKRQLSWDLDAAPGYDRALQHVLSGINTSQVVVVGHRVVHGGDRFTGAAMVTPMVRAEIAELSSLAPLHNAPALAVMDEVARQMPTIPQVAVFDTTFHTTLPPHAFLYAVPYEWYERWGVRRFGFHGLSHEYCATRAADLLETPLAQLRVVSCHLGSGCSLAAIKQGQSIATTMGFTPLDGLVMATRPGSVDPGLLTHLLANKLVTLDQLEEALHHESGLKGISGRSGDMRGVLAARAVGDTRAALAFDVYVQRLREGIGAMAAVLGGLDALIFTGGVGEGAAEVRSAACANLDWMGITLDTAANAATVPDADVAAGSSPVRVLVIHTREELMVARQTRDVFAAG